MTQNVLIYTSSNCPYCIQAKLLLENKAIVLQRIIH